MLQTQVHFDQPRKLPRPEPDEASLLKGIDLVELLAVARRHAKMVAICTAIGFGAMVVVGALSDTKYTAQASLLLGDRQIRAVQDISAPTNIVAENSLVDNQTEVVRSERVLKIVIDQLKLKDDPEFNGTEPLSLPMQAVRLVQMLNPMRLFQVSSGESDPDFRKERVAIGKLTEAIKLTRQGKSNVLQIAVTAKSPRKAAAIANGVADAYLADQITARVEQAKRAGDWFSEQSAELQKQSYAASRAVEDYRNKNNLLATNGQLFSDQQLSDLNRQLTEISAEVARNRATYDTVKAIVDSGRLDAFTPEAMDNSVIGRLRQQQADLRRRYNDNVSRVGPRHAIALDLDRQIKDVDRQIFEEFRRFLSSAETQLQRSRDREEQLAKQITAARNITSEANSSLVELRQLEQKATSLRSMYQSFLQRYQETVQQESSPINDARVISDASPPLLPSEPRMMLLAAAGMILGLGTGVGIAAYRELSDRAYRTAQQVEEDLGVEVFGMLPIVGGGRALRALPGPIHDPASPGDATLAKFAVKNPFSSFAETLRAVKIGIDDRVKLDRAKVVGVVSSMPREGKSTVSMNLAGLLALQGAKVVLIDADLREAGLTRLAGLSPAAGLGELLLDQASISDIIVAEPETGLTMLPATAKHKFFVSGDLISSPAMGALLQSLGGMYDYIIVDLPPLGPVVDGRAAAQLLDAVVMVVEWGSVPRRVVRSVVASSGAVREKMVGAVLNKVEIDKQRSYEPYGLDKRQEEVFNRYYR